MPNTNTRVGFVPKGDVLRHNKYQSGAAMYPGDLVKLDANGQVSLAAAGDAVVGVVMTYASASGQDVEVADHPDQLFIATAAGGAEIAAQTNLNLNYNHTAATASTAYKVSRQIVDASSGATNSNLTLKLLGLADESGQTFGSNARVVCKINNHQLQGGTGATGT